MKAIYAGSFDPFTNGHLQVLKEASGLFEHVIIAVAANQSKTPRFNKHKMVTAITEVLEKENIKNCSVEIVEALIGDFAKDNGVNYLIRGIRNGIDYGYEENLAQINEELFGLKTVYFRAGKTSHISSSVVTELMHYGKDVSSLVPEAVHTLLISSTTRSIQN